MLTIISSRFLFFITEVMSNFFLLPEALLMPEARGICHICQMVNPALGAMQYVGGMFTIRRLQMNVTQATSSVYIV